MKALFPMIVLTLSACATVTSAPQHVPAGVSDSPGAPGTVTIAGDELKRSGRTEIGDALRALSPIFQ
jgi:hypothetical protein